MVLQAAVGAGYAVRKGGQRPVYVDPRARLDLIDLGTEQAKHLPSGRTCPRPAEVRNPQACEGEVRPGPGRRWLVARDGRTRSDPPPSPRSMAVAHSFAWRSRRCERPIALA